MYRCNLRTALVVLTGLWSPAARADIYLGQANPSTSTFVSTDVLSFSWFTGAAKLDITNSQGTSAVAFGPDGNLYVAVGSAVLRFNPVTGAPMGALVPAGYLILPSAMTFDQYGDLWVADAYAGLQEFNGNSGAPMGSIVTNPYGYNLMPADVKFDSAGNLYVSDQQSSSILKYSGSTLTFITALGGEGGFLCPSGLAFGLNGNLYAIASAPDREPCLGQNAIFELDPSAGSLIAGPQGTGGNYLAFGPDGHIYVPETGSIGRVSPSLALSESIFTTNKQINNWTIAFGGPSVVPPYLFYNPVDLTATETIRLTAVNGPVPVGPGVPVEAQLGFVNSQGAPVGPSQVVNLNPGQTFSLDLEGSSLISSGRIQVQPVVTSLPGTPLGSLQGSAEIWTTSNGFGTVFYPGISVPPTSPITGTPSFVPQGVALGQSIQINAAATSDSPCVAMLSFTDNNGSPIGPTQQVNLSPGMMASLTFNPSKYTRSGRQEYVPQITPNNPTGGQGVAPACLGSVEVYANKTGNISTYQTSSPPVATLAAVP